MMAGWLHAETALVVGDSQQGEKKMKTTNGPIKTQHEIVKEFLALPHTALPAAWLHEEEDCWIGPAWDTLRDYLREQPGMAMTAFCGTGITLRADRDGWRDGIVIV